jgi:hypothetical protein
MVMGNMWFTVLAFLALVLSACSSPYQVARLPEREADMYPVAQSKAGVTIAIDEIRNADRAKLYFGADLIEKRIVPVSVVVSNHASQRIVVQPSDVLLYRGKDVVDPLPLEAVVNAAKRERLFLSSSAARQIDEFFKRAALSEKILLPNETYQAVMFFPAPPSRKSGDDEFSVMNLYRQAAAKLRVHVTVLDSSDRLHFGPFPLSLGEDSDRF